MGCKGCNYYNENKVKAVKAERFMTSFDGGWRDAPVAMEAGTLAASLSDR